MYIYTYIYISYTDTYVDSQVCPTIRAMRYPGAYIYIFEYIYIYIYKYIYICIDL